MATTSTAGRRKGSLDTSSTLAHLETRLSEKTDLIDDMKKVLPVTVQAPGIVVLGTHGSGKSTVLEALTGVPLSRGTGGLRRPVKVRIVSDPTCVKEYVLVSGTDPLLKENTKRLENAEELPRVLVKLNKTKKGGLFGGSSRVAAEEEDNEEMETSVAEGDDASTASSSRRSRTGAKATPALEGMIYVRVVRPSGPTYTAMDFPGFSSPPDAAQEAHMRRLLAEDNDPDKVILAVVSIKDAFDRADAVHLAKQIDPDSKRTIGVITKAHLVTKEMGIVEKLQMANNRSVVLPLGYVAVCASVPINPTAKRQQVLDYETSLFTSNPLLKGLRPERWGLYTLKSIVLNCQANSITQRIPQLSQMIRAEIEELDKDTTQAGAGAKFDKTADFFSTLCSEITAVTFDINELANGTRTRQDRKLNLGPRFLLAVETREAEARKALPAFQSPQVAEWLTRELNEFRGVITNTDSMMHPIFRKAIRELCVPLLHVYAREIMEDAHAMVKQVAGTLVEERFCNYTRLVESLKRDVATVQATKRTEGEALIQRLLEAELNWLFVDDVDGAKIQQEAQKTLLGGGGKDMELWGMDEEDSAAKNGPKLTAQNRELKAMQCALHYYVMLLLRRTFYAVPMATRNIMVNEFRADLVTMVTERYNDELKLKTLLAEELWLGQSRAQRAERKGALEEAMKKLDLLS